MNCGLPAVLAALSGQPIEVHEHVLTPPPELRAPTPAPPAEGKTVYGSNFEHHVDGQNFTVQWSGSEGDEASALAALSALEIAWTELVELEGWPQPVSSDTYFLWVLLDRGLAGTTGYTTVYTTPDYPDGYPVTYLNPDYAWDDAFWTSLAAHEFGHALQYRLRAASTGGDEESWYWEASAEWMAETAVPTADAYAYQSLYYCDNPAYRYSSMTDLHQYGMLVLNAWLEEHGPGPGSLQDVWRLGESRVGETWEGILADSTGLDVSTIWGGFTGHLANGSLRESALYFEPDQRGELEQGASGSLAYLGSDFWIATSEVAVSSSDRVALGGPDGWAETVTVAPGEVLTVTGLGDPVTDYTLELGPPSQPDDTAAPGDTDGPPADTEAPRDTASDPGDDGRPGSDATETWQLCGCNGAATGAWWLLGLVPLARRRRLREPARLRSTPSRPPASG